MKDDLVDECKSSQSIVTLITSQVQHDVFDHIRVTSVYCNEYRHRLGIWLIDNWYTAV